MTEVSTPPPMLPPDPSASVAAEPSHRRWVGWVVGIVVAVIAALSVLWLVPAQALGRVIPGHALIDEGTVANKPGTAQSTASRVTLGDIEVFEAEGEILFTTVSIDDQVSIWDWIRSEIDDDIELKTREAVFGSRTADENRQRNLQLMQSAKDTAIIAALSHLGVAVIEETGVGFEVVVEGGPVDGILVVGDVIVGVDGVEITGFQSLRDELDRKVPGELGVIRVENIDTGEFREVELTWGVHPEGLEGGFIGIQNVDVRTTDLPLPFAIEIDTGRIGGPSAGLAFALTIIDLLTEGELTGGRRIAVTGTIGVAGDVGTVGGVGQKAAAAHGSGAAAFIVPAPLVETAREHARDMPVFGVSTLEEALAALAELGGETTELRLPSRSNGS